MESVARKIRNAEGDLPRCTVDRVTLSRCEVRGDCPCDYSLAIGVGMAVNITTEREKHRRSVIGQRAEEREQQGRVRARLRVIHHYEQVTRNVSRTCRFFGISWTIFYRWLDRYPRLAGEGLRNGGKTPAERLCEPRIATEPVQQLL